MAQSAYLYTQYYQTQINLYRPFLSSSTTPNPTSLNALAICTNAARACVRIVDTLFIRAGSAYYNHSQEVRSSRYVRHLMLTRVVGCHPECCTVPLAKRAGSETAGDSRRPDKRLNGYSSVCKNIARIVSSVSILIAASISPFAHTYASRYYMSSQLW